MKAFESVLKFLGLFIELRVDGRKGFLNVVIFFYHVENTRFENTEEKLIHFYFPNIHSIDMAFAATVRNKQNRYSRPK